MTRVLLAYDERLVCTHLAYVPDCGAGHRGGQGKTAPRRSYASGPSWCCEGLRILEVDGVAASTSRHQLSCRGDPLRIWAGAAG